MPATLREGLPPVPRRMQKLPLDDRGYPVPWFVEWVDGKPDFRIMDARKLVKAVRFGSCWLCGEPLGRLRTYVIGPMCAINRTTGEPGSHLECARFAATACPFLTLPKAQRREANLPEHEKAPGFHLNRNPGVSLLWTTDEFGTFMPHKGNQSGLPLIHLGKPKQVEWYAQGRAASYDEIMESITSGLPNLQAVAEQEGLQAVMDLGKATGEAMKLLPKPFGCEPGLVCGRNGCTGSIRERPPENCTCHIAPPCGDCTENRTYCPVCGWEGKGDAP